jgi:hypothetical protein
MLTAQRHRHALQPDVGEDIRLASLHTTTIYTTQQVETRLCPAQYGDRELSIIVLFVTHHPFALPEQASVTLAHLPELGVRSKFRMKR